MQLHFLGYGSAFRPEWGNTSAFCAEEGRLLLLDCGETVFSRLKQSGLLADAPQVYAAISHLHGDHCGSLGTLALYCYFVLRRPMILVVPGAGEEAYIRQLRGLMDTFGVYPEYYTVLADQELTGFMSFRRFRYVRTEHDPKMTCFSFALDTPEGGVFYSADSATTKALEAFLREHPAPEALYMESTLQTGTVHLPLERLAEVIPPRLRGITHLMHLSDERLFTAGAALGFQIEKAE